MSTQDAAANARINPSKTLKGSLTIYYPILGLGLVLFEFLRRSSRHAYDPRGAGGSISWWFSSLKRSDGVFGWILMVYCVSDDEIMEKCGLDSLSFVRFLRMGQKVTLLIACTAAISLPLYATSALPGNRSLDPLERISLSSVPQNDRRLWVPTVFAYCITCFTLYLIWKEYKVYVDRRHEVLRRLEAAQYSILLDDLPQKLCTRVTLEKFLRDLFPGVIRCVCVAVECSQLEGYVSKREGVRNALEHSQAQLERSHQRPTHRVGAPLWQRLLFCGQAGHKVDSIEYYDKLLADLNTLVAEEIELIDAAQERLARFVDYQERFKDISRRNAQLPPVLSPNKDGESLPIANQCLPVRSPLEESEKEDSDCDEDEQTAKLYFVMRRSAFVSFTSLTAAQLAQQAVESKSPLEMNVASAPHVDDVKWENIGLRFRTRSFWRFVSGVATGLIVFFWTIPTAFVVSLATVESLRHTLPFLNHAIDKYPILEQVFKQLAPLLLLGMSALAPVVFKFLSTKEGHASETEVRASLFTKLAFFQLIQIFFVTVIVGTILDSLKQIIDHPKAIIDMLGRSMPQQSAFFMSYIIVLTGLSITLELLRVVPWILDLLFRSLAPQLTRRERNAKWLGMTRISRTDSFDPTSTFADCFLVMLVSLTFSTIAPLVCCFTGFFFLVADVVYRRQMLSVYKPSTFAMGAYWPRLYNFLIAALVLSQLTLLGLLSLKLAAVQFALILVLIFFTLVFHHYISRLYPRVAKNLPLKECVRMDDLRSKQNQDNLFQFVDNVYRQPAMSERRPLQPNADLNEDTVLAYSPPAIHSQVDREAAAA